MQLLEQLAVGYGYHQVGMTSDSIAMECASLTGYIECMSSMEMDIVTEGFGGKILDGIKRIINKIKELINKFINFLKGQAIKHSDTIDTITKAAGIPMTLEDYLELHPYHGVEPKVLSDGGSKIYFIIRGFTFDTMCAQLCSSLTSIFTNVNNPNITIKLNGWIDNNEKQVNDIEERVNELNGIRELFVKSVVDKKILTTDEFHKLSAACSSQSTLDIRKIANNTIKELEDIKKELDEQEQTTNKLISDPEILQRAQKCIQHESVVITKAITAINNAVSLNSKYIEPARRYTETIEIKVFGKKI